MTESTINDMTTQFDRKLEQLYRHGHDQWGDAAREVHDTLAIAKLIVEEQFGADHVSPETVIPVMSAIFSRARHSHSTE